MIKVSRIRQAANWLSVSITVVMTILIPIFMVSLKLNYAKGSIDSEIVINSRIISDRINDNPEMWQYEQIRFEEILSRRPQNGEKEIRRIINNQNHVIAESVEDLSPPLLKRSHDLKESGVTVGKIEIYRSYRPFLWDGLFFSIFGTVIAALISIFMNILPFRILSQTQDALEKSENTYKILTQTSQTGIFICQNEKIIYANPKFAELQGCALDEIIGKKYFDLFPLDQKDMIEKVESKKIHGQSISQYKEVRRVKKNGEILWCQTVSANIEYQGKPAIMGNMLDITHRKLAEEERTQLISDLQKALSDVKTLRGLLPICSYCKKIRDDKGYWNQIETYIHDHSEAKFTHSICNECAKKYYPEIDF